MVRMIIKNGTDQLGMLCVKSWSKGSGSRDYVIRYLIKDFKMLGHKQSLLVRLPVLLLLGFDLLKKEY